MNITLCERERSRPETGRRAGKAAGAAIRCAFAGGRFTAGFRQLPVGAYIIRPKTLRRWADNIRPYNRPLYNRERSEPPKLFTFNCHLSTHCPSRVASQRPHKTPSRDIACRATDPRHALPGHRPNSYSIKTIQKFFWSFLLNIGQKNAKINF